MNDTERLTKLEEAFLHLEHHVSEQDKVILALSEDLKRLRREVTILRERQTDSEDIANERPPHY
ncbi:MAG: SlyX family protein [Verrucomicrobiota bacterium]